MHKNRRDDRLLPSSFQEKPQALVLPGKNTVEGSMLDWQKVKALSTL